MKIPKLKIRQHKLTGRWWVFRVPGDPRYDRYGPCKTLEQAKELKQRTEEYFRWCWERDLL